MLKRIKTLLSLLQSNEPPKTRREIANRLRREGLTVTDRTVQRDLDFLRDDGYEIRFQRNRGFTCRSSKGRLRDLSATHEEMLPGLVLIRSLLSSLCRIDDAAGADVLKKQIDEMLNKQNLAADRLDCYISTTSPVMSQRLVPVFRTLVRALMQQKVTRIWYKGYKDAKARERCVEPFHLFEAEGRWYFIAHCHEKQAEGVFALFRTEKAEATGTTFERPADYNEPQYWEAKAQVFGIWTTKEEPVNIKVRMWDYAARLIREASHRPPAMKIVELSDEDGTVEVTFKAHALEEEVIPWVLRWGPYCKVLSPPVLLEKMRDHLRQIAGLYEDDF